MKAIVIDHYFAMTELYAFKIPPIEVFIEAVFVAMKFYHCGSTIDKTRKLLLSLVFKAFPDLSKFIFRKSPIHDSISYNSKKFFF